MELPIGQRAHLAVRVCVLKSARRCAGNEGHGVSLQMMTASQYSVLHSDEGRINLVQAGISRVAKEMNHIRNLFTIGP